MALEGMPDQGVDGGTGQDIAFSQEWIDRHGARGGADLATVQVPDDSMAPLLPTGAVLVVERGGAEINRDGIYALTMDGTLLVRRLQRMPGGQIEASPESSTYQSFRFQQNDPAVSVIGRVVWAGRDL